MRHIPALSVVALAAASLFSPGTTVMGQQLAYRLPSPATAVYQMVDTTVGTMTTLDGSSDVSGNSVITYTLSFEPDGDGVRASVDLTDFEGRIQPPMGAPMSVSQTQAGLRSYVVRLGGRGLEEFASGQRRRAPNEFPLFVDAWEAVFPRLPGGEVGPGDSWVDTVTTWVAGEAKRVVAYTYTLDSNTTVDGRDQLRITVSGDARLTLTEGGTSMTMNGSETGFFLWDIERGLVAWWEVSRRYEGNVQDSSESVSVVFNATTRVRLASTGS